jgi:hypothetical protein
VFLVRVIGYRVLSVEFEVWVFRVRGVALGVLVYCVECMV